MMKTSNLTDNVNHNNKKPAATALDNKATNNNNNNSREMSSSKNNNSEKNTNNFNFMNASQIIERIRHNIAQVDPSIAVAHHQLCVDRELDRRRRREAARLETLRQLQQQQQQHQNEEEEDDDDEEEYDQDGVLISRQRRRRNENSPKPREHLTRKNTILKKRRVLINKKTGQVVKILASCASDGNDDGNDKVSNNDNATPSSEGQIIGGFTAKIVIHPLQIPQKQQQPVSVGDRVVRRKTEPNVNVGKLAPASAAAGAPSNPFNQNKNKHNNNHHNNDDDADEGKTRCSVDFDASRKPSAKDATAMGINDIIDNGRKGSHKTSHVTAFPTLTSANSSLPPHHNNNNNVNNNNNNNDDKEYHRANTSNGAGIAGTFDFITGGQKEQIREPPSCEQRVAANNDNNNDFDANNNNIEGKQLPHSLNLNDGSDDGEFEAPGNDPGAVGGNPLDFSKKIREVAERRRRQEQEKAEQQHQQRILQQHSPNAVKNTQKSINNTNNHKSPTATTNHQGKADFGNGVNNSKNDFGEDVVDFAANNNNNNNAEQQQQQTRRPSEISTKKKLQQQQQIVLDLADHNEEDLEEIEEIYEEELEQEEDDEGNNNDDDLLSTENNNKNTNKKRNNINNNKNRMRMKDRAKNDYDDDDARDDDDDDDEDYSNALGNMPKPSVGSIPMTTQRYRPTSKNGTKRRGSSSLPTNNTSSSNNHHNNNNHNQEVTTVIGHYAALSNAPSSTVRGLQRNGSSKTSGTGGGGAVSPSPRSVGAGGRSSPSSGSSFADEFDGDEDETFRRYPFATKGDPLGGKAQTPCRSRPSGKYILRERLSRGAYGEAWLVEYVPQRIGLDRRILRSAHKEYRQALREQKIRIDLLIKIQDDIQNKKRVATAVVVGENTDNITDVHKNSNNKASDLTSSAPSAPINIRDGNSVGSVSSSPQQPKSTPFPVSTVPWQQQNQQQNQNQQNQGKNTMNSNINTVSNIENDASCYSPAQTKYQKRLELHAAAAAAAAEEANEMYHQCFGKLTKERRRSGDEGATGGGGDVTTSSNINFVGSSNSNAKNNNNNNPLDANERDRQQFLRNAVRQTLPPVPGIFQHKNFVVKGAIPIENKKSPDEALQHDGHNNNKNEHDDNLKNVLVRINNIAATRSNTNGTAATTATITTSSDEKNSNASHLQQPQGVVIPLSLATLKQQDETKNKNNNNHTVQEPPRKTSIIAKISPRHRGKLVVTSGSHRGAASETMTASNNTRITQDNNHPSNNTTAFSFSQDLATERVRMLAIPTTSLGVCTAAEAAADERREKQLEAHRLKVLEQQRLYVKKQAQEKKRQKMIERSKKEMEEKQAKGNNNDNNEENNKNNEPPTADIINEKKEADDDDAEMAKAKKQRSKSNLENNPEEPDMDEDKNILAESGAVRRNREKKSKRKRSHHHHKKRKRGHHHHHPRDNNNNSNRHSATTTNDGTNSDVMSSLHRRQRGVGDEKEGTDCSALSSSASSYSGSESHSSCDETSQDDTASSDQDDILWQSVPSPGDVSFLSCTKTTLTTSSGVQVPASRGYVCKIVFKEPKSSSLRQAIDEMRVLASCAHPCILAYIESFKQFGRLHLITEYVDCGDLSMEIKKRRTRTKKPFAEQTILSIFVQVCLALEYLHRHNILHRDLKPANVLLSRVWVAKLCDFGMSLQSNFDVDGRVSTTCLGTPTYQAPEVSAGRSYGEKADMWSLGCVLYELLCLRPPWISDDPIELERLMRDTPFPSINRSDISPHTRELLHFLLVVNPSRRYSAKQILQLPFMQQTVQNFVTKYEKSAIKSGQKIDARYAKILQEHAAILADEDPKYSSTKSRRSSKNRVMMEKRSRFSREVNSGRKTGSKQSVRTNMTQTTSVNY